MKIDIVYISEDSMEQVVQPPKSGTVGWCDRAPAGRDKVTYYGPDMGGYEWLTDMEIARLRSRVPHAGCVGC